jgi:hypothetical protein
MSTRPEPIDFGELALGIVNSICADPPVVLGGVWKDEAALAQQIEAYRGNPALKWRIWETTDTCTIGHAWLDVGIEWLERARLFGPGGDLDVRRDGRRFLWRYVGDAEHAPKDEKAQAMTMDGSERDPLYCSERTALLWGTRKGEQNQWFEDRVAGAPLTYLPDPPLLPDKMEERVQVRFCEYTQAGRTLAVWLLGLEAYQEADNG